MEKPATDINSRLIKILMMMMALQNENIAVVGVYMLAVFRCVRVGLYSICSIRAVPVQRAIHILGERLSPLFRCFPCGGGKGSKIREGLTE